MPKIRRHDIITITCKVDSIGIDGIIRLSLPTDNDYLLPYVKPDAAITIVSQPLMGGDKAKVLLNRYGGSTVDVISIDGKNAFVKLSKPDGLVTHVIEPISNLRRIDDDE